MINSSCCDFLRLTGRSNPRSEKLTSECCRLLALSVCSIQRAWLSAAELQLAEAPAITWHCRSAWLWLRKGNAAGPKTSSFLLLFFWGGGGVGGWGVPLSGPLLGRSSRLETTKGEINWTVFCSSLKNPAQVMADSFAAAVRSPPTP